MIFNRSAVDAVIVGLGNPGEKYLNTRHNAGFRAIDYIAGKTNTDVRRLKHMSLTGKCEMYGKRVLLAKPQTYMNSSGEAVLDIIKYYKLSPSQVFVICDDITLLCGSLRIRKKGTHGGHNGLKSIISVIGTDEFPRIRLGIGNKHGNGEAIDFVLSNFSSGDNKALTETFEPICQALPLLLEDRFEDAMSKFNITVRE